MLADAARVESGKLYIHGGGWDTLWVPTLPVVHPTLAVAVVMEIGWNEAFRSVQLGVDLYDEDESIVLVGGRGLMQIGHPPDSTPGMSFLIPWQSTFNGLRFEREGMFSFRVMADHEELARLRCRVTRIQMPMLPGMGGLPGSGPIEASEA